jgi:hypothetical protein
MMLTALLPWIERFPFTAIHGCRRSRLHDGVDFYRDVLKRGAAAWLGLSCLFIASPLDDCMTE